MNDSNFYNSLRLLWYLLIIPVILAFNLFYRFYYHSDDRLILLTVIKAYSKAGFSEIPLHLYGVIVIFAILLSCILLFNPFQTLYARNRVHGSARFAKQGDIKRLGLLKGKGTVLCQWKKRILFLSEPLSVLLLAPPGTYKTTGVAIPTLFLSPNSIIALDVKKELFQITSKHRSTFSHIMLFEPTSDTTSRWNPLDASILPDTFAERYVTVQNIASNIYVKSESTSDPYWIDSARELFINIAIALIHQDGGTSIPAVYEASLGSGENSRKDAIADLGSVPGLYEPVAKRLSAYKHTADQQFSGTLGTFDTGLMGFQDPRVKRAVSGCDIVFRDFRGLPDKSGKTLPVTLYLVIRPVDVERLSPLIRVFFETLSKYLLSTEWDKKTECPITFLLDEFPRLGKMEDIIKMPALSRGQGVSSILIAQDAGQIERVYQKSGREEIMSTTAYKIIPSQNSFESAKLISDTIGDETIKTASDSRTNNTFFGGSRSYREQGKKLLSPQKIMSLKAGKCYVISQFAAETPIKADLAIWFKDKRMRKLVGEINTKDIYRPSARTDDAVLFGGVASFFGQATSPGDLSARLGGDIPVPTQEVIDTFYALKGADIAADFGNHPEDEWDNHDSSPSDNETAVSSSNGGLLPEGESNLVESNDSTNPSPETFPEDPVQETPDDALTDPESEADSISSESAESYLETHVHSYAKNIF